MQKLIINWIIFVRIGANYVLKYFDESITICDIGMQFIDIPASEHIFFQEFAKEK